MAAALRLLIGGPAQLYVVAFALLSLRPAGVHPVPALRADPEMADADAVRLCRHARSWCMCRGDQVRATRLVCRTSSLERGLRSLVVAVFGTTISPYLFFWQAVAGSRGAARRTRPRKPLMRAPEQARGATCDRIKLDTYVGMVFSNLVAFFIMLTTAATLHAARHHRHPDLGAGGRGAAPDRRASSRSPLFASGIIGTGLLAVPVLAGSAAYAVAEAFRWPIGLGLRAGRGARLLRHHRPWRRWSAWR